MKYVLNYVRQIWQSFSLIFVGFILGQSYRYHDLWFSRPADFTAYKQRVIHEKITCRRQISRQYSDYVPTVADYR